MLNARRDWVLSRIFSMIKIFNLNIEANPFTDQVTTPIDRNGNSGQEMRLQPQNDTGGNEMVMQQ